MSQVGHGTLVHALVLAQWCNVCEELGHKQGLAHNEGLQPDEGSKQVHACTDAQCGLGTKEDADSEQQD